LDIEPTVDASLNMNLKAKHATHYIMFILKVRTLISKANLFTDTRKQVC